MLVALPCFEFEVNRYLFFFPRIKSQKERKYKCRKINKEWKKDRGKKEDKITTDRERNEKYGEITS